MIRIKNLTKNIGKKKGVFDISFEVVNGEVFGILGPKGAGKTTLLRQLMGFAVPNRGKCSINGKNCTLNYQTIRKFTGYLPERSELPKDMTGLDFFRFMAQLRGEKSIERGLFYAQKLHIATDEKIKKMDAAKQQLLKAASILMHDPQVLILDEPMKDLKRSQVDLLLQILGREKRRGKTIILTSDRYEDVERICDRVMMIQHGIQVNIDEISQIRMDKKQLYSITFATEQDAMRFAVEDFQVQEAIGSRVTVCVYGEMLPLVKILGKYPVVSIETLEQDLDEIFACYFGGDDYD